ncbi:MAG TPA: protein kinase [Candidatus Solibacter sp.]|nr:protein kinase [Candidatus Solibacter sp.]
MTLASGSKLGPYEIQSPIGAGGMGEVYRARDTRLGREVAIKVLPETLARDADRLRRFEQEARTIAALNHPNILGIHDIGTHDGAPFLVSELLEGQTLRETIAAGPLPVRRASEYALGIATGLAAAHDKGIVHRDLKPENVFITRDGRVKVLDFGLAKLVLPEESHDTVATLPSPATLPGTVMGTVGYMSPEQVKGGATDARSDIFSFGAVLYEMITGKRAFKRDTSAETMTAILREEPAELTDTGWQGPAALQRILHRCLEKNVERRFQSASDLAFAIESLSGSASGASATSARPIVESPKTRRTGLRVAAAVLSVLALIAAAWIISRRSAVKPPPKFSRLTYQQGYPSNARFARDGQTVVYSAQWNSDPLQVYSVRTEFPQSTKVDLPSAALLALSSSGDMELAVDPVYESWFLYGTMGQAQMSGGKPRAQEKEVIAADYAPDGKTLAIVRRANRKVQLEYPEGKVIYATAGYFDYVRVSPDGKEVAFAEHPVYGDDRGWVSAVDGSGNHKQLTQEFGTVQGLAWSRTGAEIWFTGADVTTDRQLFGVSLSGKLRPILSTPQGARLLDVASDGRVLLCIERQQPEIAGIDPATGKERRGLEWFDASVMGDITPDGKAIVFLEWGGPAGPLYLMVYRQLDGSAPVALGPGAQPRFSPDGTMAAGPLLTRPPQVVLNPIGTGESRRLAAGEITSLKNVVWFPDGKHLLLIGAAEGQTLRTYEMDLDGGKPQPLGPPDFTGLAVAGDGKRIAGRNASGGAVVFDRETQKLQAIPGIELTETLAKWTEDGQALLVHSTTPWEGRIYRVEAATGKRTLLQKVEPHDKAGAITPMRLAYAERSKTYVYSTVRILGTLYVAEGLE